MLVSSLEPLTSTLTDRQQEILNESGYFDLMRDNIVGFSVRLQPMQNHVAVAVRQALVGDETKMRMMSIGGAGASPCRLR